MPWRVFGITPVPCVIRFASLVCGALWDRAVSFHLFVSWEVGVSVVSDTRDALAVANDVYLLVRALADLNFQSHPFRLVPGVLFDNVSHF